MGAEEDRKEKGYGGRGGGSQAWHQCEEEPWKGREALFLSGCPKAMISRG